MKTLLLLRHAKSSWDDPTLSDFARPLNNRGLDAATRMGKYLQEEGLIPEVILCSAARRTQQTCDLVRAQLEETPEIRLQRSLYMADPEEILMEVHVQTDTVQTVMVVAHYPGVQTLARRLAGWGDEEELLRMSQKFPTAGLAVLTSPAERWASVTRGSCTLDRFVRPKDLS